MPERICSVEGCPKIARTRGWCSAHYERWRRNGDPGAAGDGRRREPKFCVVCNRKARRRSRTGVGPLCEGCRWREDAHGDPFVRVNKEPDGRRLAENGYVYRYAPAHPLAHADGYVAEHRMVAWEHGILTDLSHHVHHVNENKADNRPENLESLDPIDHQSHHVETTSAFVNQYGTFPRLQGACAVEGCDRAARSRGWCVGHYSRWVRHGDVDAKTPIRKVTR